jgi:hypothetical protein
MHSYKAPAVVLDELGITEPSEIIIEAIAHHCGVTIVYEPLAGCEARILGGTERAIVTVNSRASRGRQRFSAAHEVGHWMRDRGRIAFACTERSFVSDWVDESPERRANRYAADLLLPKKLFERAAQGMPVTFESARSLAKTFETSMTAASIRLVELGANPSMVVCSDVTGRRWFVRSPLVPSSLWPLAKPGSGSNASKLLGGTGRSIGAETVDADDWIDHVGASDYVLTEDSVSAGNGMVLTLLWWKDEKQILDCDDEDD